MQHDDWSSPTAQLALHRLGLHNARTALGCQIESATPSHELLEANRNAILALVALGERLTEQLQRQLDPATPRSPKPVPVDVEFNSASADWEIVRRHP